MPTISSPVCTSPDYPCKGRGLGTSIGVRAAKMASRRSRSGLLNAAMKRSIDARDLRHIVPPGHRDPALTLQGQLPIDHQRGLFGNLMPQGSDLPRQKAEAQQAFIVDVQ